jgi:hypothetical protein
MLRSRRLVAAVSISEFIERILKFESVIADGVWLRGEIGIGADWPSPWCVSFHSSHCTTRARLMGISTTGVEENSGSDSRNRQHHTPDIQQLRRQCRLQILPQNLKTYMPAEWPSRCSTQVKPRSGLIPIPPRGGVPYQGREQAQKPEWWGRREEEGSM